MYGKRRSCRKKRRHPDRQSAIQHREELIRDRYAFRDNMTIYECEHCGYWHVGHRRGTNTDSHRRR